MAIQRIDDMDTPPVVGRFYLVRHATSSWPNVPWSGVPLPILGGAHTDIEIAPNVGRHYHYDMRFFDRKLFRTAFGCDANRTLWWATHTNLRREMGSILDAEFVVKVEHIRVKCVRLTPEFPAAAKFAAKVEGLFGNLRMDPEKRVCPHRGMDLRTVEVGHDGCLTCPGHGLKWNATTGEMVSRIGDCER